MLEKSVLDKPGIVRLEQNIQPVKAGKGWFVKVIIIIIIIALLIWLFLHPQGIQNSVNDFFNNILT
jgi:hypothetical protein